MNKTQIFLNWSEYNINVLPPDTNKEYNFNIIPKFEKDNNVYYLKSFFKKLELELRNSNRRLCFKTDHYNYNIGDPLNAAKYREAYEIQLERYKQGFEDGFKLKQSLKGDNLFRWLKVEFTQIDFSGFFKHNDILIVLVEEGTHHEFEIIYFDLYDYGKRVGHFVNCWEHLLSEYYPKPIDDLKNEVERTNNIPKKIRYKARYYVLAYLFDCDIEGKLPVTGKIKLEGIGVKYDIIGNTFYKNYNTYSNIDRNNSDVLIDSIGDNWRDAVLALSKNPKKIENYLKNKLL